MIALGRSRVVAHDYAEVEAYDRALVRADGRAHVIAHNASIVEAGASVETIALDSAVIAHI